MMQKIVNLIAKKGLKAILPHKLPKQEFKYLKKIAGECMLDAQGKKKMEETEENRKAFDCLCFCVTSILSYQRGKGKDNAKSEDEMMDCVLMYSLALIFEKLNKAALLKSERLTLDNIFDKNRETYFQIEDTPLARSFSAFADNPESAPKWSH
ncbi:MAG: hypothetical protein GY710_15275 [Desulfobacteraceae bacterium]|nr:hypothetical protein [Desulfobacteraceae bacterium]